MDRGTHSEAYPEMASVLQRFVAGVQDALEITFSAQRIPQDSALVWVLLREKSELECKQMPGSGGEHRDPGWLFRDVANRRGDSGSPAVRPEGAGERITHPRVCVAAACLSSAGSPIGTAMLFTPSSDLIAGRRRYGRKPTFLAFSGGTARSRALPKLLIRES